MLSINPNFVFVIIGSLEPWTSVGARLLARLISPPCQRRRHPAWGQDVVGCTAERLQGPWGRGEGGGKKGEKIPKARKAGREAGPGAGNRGYLQRCPRAAVGLALAVLALEPAAPPSALGHPGTAMDGAPLLARSSRPRRRVAWGPAPGQGASLGWLRGGAGRGATPVGGEVGGGEVRLGRHRARGAACPRGGSRQWRGAPGAGWARRIAQSCGLARVADLRGEGAGRRDLF